LVFSGKAVAFSQKPRLFLRKKATEKADIEKKGCFSLPMHRKTVAHTPAGGKCKLEVLGKYKFAGVREGWILRKEASVKQSTHDKHINLEKVG